MLIGSEKHVVISQSGFFVLCDLLVLIFTIAWKICRTWINIKSILSSWINAWMFVCIYLWQSGRNVMTMVGMGEWARSIIPIGYSNVKPTRVSFNLCSWSRMQLQDFKSVQTTPYWCLPKPTELVFSDRGLYDLSACSGKHFRMWNTIVSWDLQDLLQAPYIYCRSSSNHRYTMYVPHPSQLCRKVSYRILPKYLGDKSIMSGWHSIVKQE